MTRITESADFHHPLTVTFTIGYLLIFQPNYRVVIRKSIGNFNSLTLSGLFWQCVNG